MSPSGCRFGPTKIWMRRIEWLRDFGNVAAKQIESQHAEQGVMPKSTGNSIE